MKIKNIFIASIVAVAGVSLSACTTKMIDYAHNGSATLNLEYQGHDFMVDGIGEVTLKTCIDGDTAHFYPAVGHTDTILKARFYGIDTPESTGAVQPYGKAASNFTKEKLKNAAANGTIVVSSPAQDYQTPEFDSTGSRYLSLVWINETVKHAAKDDLVLLNLWIVQEGLSWAKGVDKVPEYADVFQDAQNQAEKRKLNLWSGKEDPDFNYGDYQDVSLLDLKNENKLYIEDNSHVNAYSGVKVRFTGVVSGYSDHNLYVQEYYPVDEDDPSKGGEWAGINVFTGMTSISSMYTEIGAYIQVVGLAQQTDNFGFQVTDTQGHWPTSPSTDPVDCQLLLSAEENSGEHGLYTFQYTADEMKAHLKGDINTQCENLYCMTEVTSDLTVNYVNATSSGDVTLGFKETTVDCYIPFQYTGNPNNAADIWNSEEEFIGKTFNIKGVFSYHFTSSGKLRYQIIPSSSADLVCKTEMKGTVASEPFNVAETVALATELGLEEEETVITYYTLGTFVEGITKGRREITVNYETVEVDCMNFAITDGHDTIYVKNATFDEKNEKLLAKDAKVLVKGKLVYDGQDLCLVDGGLCNVYPHGTTVDDPFNIEEAVTYGMTLASTDSKVSPTVYFVSGVVQSITSPLNEKRISFTITNGEGCLTVESARAYADIDLSTLQVGSNVIIRSKIAYDSGNVVLSGAAYVFKITNN